MYVFNAKAVRPAGGHAIRWMLLFFEIASRFQKNNNKTSYKDNAVKMSAIRLMDDYPALLARIGRGNWVGRAREMAEAHELWRLVTSGEGRVLLISGDAGVGKTRFVRELSSEVADAGACVLTGECYLEGSAPYAPASRIIAGYFESSGQTVLELPDEVLTNLAILVPALRQRFAECIAGLIPDSQSVQTRIFDGFFQFCSALSTQHPLLIFIDDVQWADADTLALLRGLARQSRKLPILTVMTYRDAELDWPPGLKELLLELNRERLATHIGLAPLDRAESGDLLSALFSGEVEAEFFNEVFTQTEGNPFFIEEVCKALIETGQIVYREGRWHYPTKLTAKIPQTVRAAIQSRLHQLPAAAQDALRMAAILGREFDFITLRYAAHLDEEALIQYLESAVQAQIITEVRSERSAVPRFGFVHVLIPTTLRESIIHVRRRRYHLQAAQAIESVRPNDYEALAYHYVEAGEAERARAFYRLAGDRARQAAPADAARFYRAALDQWQDEDLAGKAEITAQLGYTLEWIGDSSGALHCFEEAYVLFDQLKNHNQSGEMQRMIGCMYWEGADHARSMQHHQQALAILEQGPETPELARAICSISKMHMLAAEDELAIPWGFRAVEMAERLGADDVVIQALISIGSALACSGCEFEKGSKILEESVQRSLKAGLSLEVCHAYGNLGDIQRGKCHYSSARETMQTLFAYAEQIYANGYVNGAIFELMWIDWATGQWRSALTYRSMITDFTGGLEILIMKRIYSMIDLDLGRIEEGCRVLEESLPDALRARDLQTTAPHLGQLVRAYSASGKEKKALETIRQILEFLSNEDQIAGDSIMALFFACQALAKMPNSHPAAEISGCLEQLEFHAKRYQTGEAAAALAEAQGCLAAEADPAAAVEHFRQAAAHWKSIERPYDQVRALSALGSALASTGERESARQAREQALGLFNELAAQLDPQNQAVFLNSPVYQALRLDEKAALRPQTDHDPDSLSGREIEVLRLVAQGLTNGQIAERLVLSPLTVNAHLRSIFNKLDVTTRTAAAHQAMERGWIQ
jgi:DNA-binding CsgD family transcriptional regulator